MFLFPPLFDEAEVALEFFLAVQFFQLSQWLPAVMHQDVCTYSLGHRWIYFMLSEVK